MTATTRTGDNQGTMALPDGGRVDFPGLRAERRARVLDQMERAGIDVLVLGREDNARYASGARRLWTAFTRPFGPGCLIVRATGAAHVLSTWDDGIPDEIPRDHLYGITWNPGHMITALARIDGLADATVIGTDGMSPSFGRLVAAVAPKATIVDGDAAMRAARVTKTPDEVACITTACRIAEAAHDHARVGVRVGATERELVGRFVQRMTDFGVTTPASENVAVVTSPDRPELRRLCDHRELTAGDLTAFDVGVLYNGYEGGFARTVSVGEPSPAALDLAARAGDALDRLVAACRADATGADLVAAHQAAVGAVPADLPIVRGVGLGFEPPVVTDRFGHAEKLLAGQTLTAQVWLWEAGTGGVLLRDTLLVTDAEPLVLSRASRRMAV